MTVLLCLLTIAYLLLLPWFLKMAFGGKERTYLFCVILCFSGFEMLYLAAAKANLGLKGLLIMLSVFSGAVCILGGLRLLLQKGLRESTRESALKKCARLKEEKAAAFVALLGMAILYYAVISQSMPTDSPLYDHGERTVGILREGDLSFQLTSSLSGSAALSGKMEGLPALYACLCRGFSLSPLILLRFVIPLFVLLLLYLTVGRISMYFSEKGTAWAFLGLTFSGMCAQKAYRNPFYDLLHLPYEGRCFLALFLLPAAFLFLLFLTKGKAKPALILFAAGAFVLAGLCFGGLYKGVLPCVCMVLIWEISVWISRFIS
ncbi:MAG: hypothetical protein K5739_07700 [Lachnospiraceae bacterium]|nr:hypothetical protein [Lachnospiraceae bacterium]